MSRLHRAIRPVRSEAGFTMVEVMVAIVLLSIGLVAVAGSFDSSTRGTLVAQRHEQAISIAQREVERLKTVPYASLGLSSLPAHETAGTGPGDPTPANPNFYVTGTSFEIKANYLNSASANRAVEPMVSGGTVATRPPDETVGTPASGTPTTARIYRYVTWRDEQCEHCTGEGAGFENRDSKRVTVAVVLETADGAPGPNKPVWVSSVINDPNAQPPPTAPPPAPPVTAQQFFPYDTRCAPATTARQPLGVSHLSHDSARDTGSCSNGTATLRHDLAWNEAPSGAPADLMPDFSLDVGLLQGRTRLRGLGLMRHTPDCATAATTYTLSQALDRQRKIHTFATNPFPSAFRTPETDADIAFSLFTETANGTSGDVTLCVQIRRASAPGTVIYRGEYRNSNWPTTPTQLPNFSFGPAQGLPQDLVFNANDRLLVTLSVKSTSTDDINLLYDHPAYPSVFTVDTTTPLP